MKDHIQDKYPIAFKALLKECSKNERLFVKVCRENKVPANDMYKLINTALQYHENTLNYSK